MLSVIGAATTDSKIKNPRKIFRKICILLSFLKKKKMDNLWVIWYLQRIYEHLISQIHYFYVWNYYWYITHLFMMTQWFILFLDLRISTGCFGHTNKKDLLSFIGINWPQRESIWKRERKIHANLFSFSSNFTYFHYIIEKSFCETSQKLNYYIICLSQKIIFWNVQRCNFTFCSTTKPKNIGKH